MIWTIINNASLCFHAVLVNSLALTFSHTIANGPVRFVIFQLQFMFMASMAVQYAALANPFCVTSIANIKCARFSFFPFIAITVDFLHKRNASLYLYCIPCQHAESIFYTHLHTIHYHLIFYFASKLYIALRAYFLNIWQQRFESGHGS